MISNRTMLHFSTLRCQSEPLPGRHSTNENKSRQISFDYFNLLNLLGNGQIGKMFPVAEQNLFLQTRRKQCATTNVSKDRIAKKRKPQKHTNMDEPFVEEQPCNLFKSRRQTKKKKRLHACAGEKKRKSKQTKFNYTPSTTAN